LCAGFGLSQTFLAKADGVDTVISSSVLPQSEVENYDLDLNPPIDAFYWDDKFAIIADNFSNNLIVYQNGIFQTKNLISPKQVRKLGENKLVISQNAALYSLDLNDLDAAPEKLKGTGTSGIEDLGMETFDVNDNYIVTAVSTFVNVYKYNADTPSDWQAQVGGANTDTPISINDKNEIFLVSDNCLKKYTYNPETKELGYTSTISHLNPSAILADNDNVFYIVGNKIYRNLTSGTSADEQLLTVLDVNKDFDLGNITSPVSLAFKNGNLLISDNAVKAVQEFKVDTKNNQLIFTGFAIAKNKTAFNRIGVNAFDIERSKNKTAVLDDNKLTVIEENESGKIFKNFLLKNNLKAIKGFAFGNDEIVCFADTSLVKIDLKTNAISAPKEISGVEKIFRARNLFPHTTLDKVGDIDRKERKEHHTQTRQQHSEHLTHSSDCKYRRTHSGDIQPCPPESRAKVINRVVRILLVAVEQQCRDVGKQHNKYNVAPHNGTNSRECNHPHKLIHPHHTSHQRE
jgi:hypothetical protein